MTASTHRRESRQGRDSLAREAMKAELVATEVREEVRNRMMDIINSPRFQNKLYRDIEARERHVSKETQESYVNLFVARTREWLLHRWDAIDGIIIGYLAGDTSRCQVWLDQMWKEELEEE